MKIGIPGMASHCINKLRVFCKNQIEFWFNRKKVFKTNTLELFNEALLFPLFNIQQPPETFTEKQGIYIVQKEIGNLGVYELEVNADNLLLDDFKFETELYQNSKIISRITIFLHEYKIIKCFFPCFKFSSYGVCPDGFLYFMYFKA